ncbi:MAG: hypothetical protein QXO75_01075, partial [Nitrososphaerota archaeon]
ATFDLNSADWRWHQLLENTDAYDSPQHHWIAALHYVPGHDHYAIANDSAHYYSDRNIHDNYLLGHFHLYCFWNAREGLG